MDEKLEKALECCSRVNCCACPKLKDVNCMSNLYAEVKRYIDDLEERLAIMQESMDEQKKRNEPMKPTLNESHSYVSDAFKCGKCGHTIRFHAKYCEDCGQEVRWSE